MMSDASDMLAAALEQMDGIIAGSKALEYSNGIFDCQSPTSPFMGSLRVLHLVEDLRGLLELMEVEEKEGLRCQIPDSTAETVVEWLQGHMTNGYISASGDVYQERLTRLESDKESLVLQVSVLTDQVEAQGEKIRDLDFCLEEHREKLNATEEMLQQELLSRSALETQKLDLMAEISNLKLKLTALEKDRLDFEERFRDSEGLIQEINELRFTITDMENERLQYEKKLKSTKSLMAKLSSLKIKVGQMQYEKQRMEHKSQTLKDELVILKDKLEQKDGEVKRLWDESLYKITSATGGSEKDEKDLEVQKMKRAVESLMAANEEKDRKIEELRQSLNRYKKVQDMVMSAQVKKDKLKEGSSEESQSDSSVSTAISVSIESEKPPSPVARNEKEIVKTPHEIPVQMQKSVLQVSIPALASSPMNFSETEQAQSQETEDWGLSEMRTPSIPNSSMDNLKSSDTDKNKAYEEISTFSALPPTPPGQSGSVDDESFGSRKARSSFGRGFFKIKGSKRTASAPNLGGSLSAIEPKELGIKQPLHRKKLQLALQALGSEEDDRKGRLDYNWVTRWLDDIGLPQYKTQFDEGRVDGRMLHYMTVSMLKDEEFFKELSTCSPSASVTDEDSNV
ncbi:Liprin-beta-1 [Acipenser ruthenus]|uniref:Liprin-beta-1 n=1 Tax=Acipenser ruthenus TaxID=7906 RepID=A0A444U1C2_ACIRT|nr:Liprin-beta-1 [Acipenser ruthenus]